MLEMLKIQNAVTMLCRKASMLKCNNVRMQPSNKLKFGPLCSRKYFQKDTRICMNNARMFLK